MLPENYQDKLQEEIRNVPDEYMAALLNVVRAFRKSRVKRSLEEDFQRRWEQAQEDDIHLIEMSFADVDDSIDTENW